VGNRVPRGIGSNPCRDRPLGILKVILLGLSKWPMKAIAPLVVLFLDDEARQDNRVFGVADAIDTSWWNIAIRNGCHNMYTRPMPQFSWKGNTSDFSMENGNGLQWRTCTSTDGSMTSFRATWGSPRPKGKREFYVGWVMNHVAPYARLTFFQFRPF